MRYLNCRFCGGRGCLACNGEREKDARLAQGPIFTAEFDIQHDMKILLEYFGREAMDKAFGPNGGGRSEILRNAAIAKFLQLVEKAKREREEGGEEK